MFKLPEGFSLPEGVRVEDLQPDPGKRDGHYLDMKSDRVYSLGVRLEKADMPEPTTAKGKAGGAVSTARVVEFGKFEQVSQASNGYWEASVKVADDVYVEGWNISKFYGDDFEIQEPVPVVKKAVRLTDDHRNAIFAAIKAKRLGILREIRG